MEPRPTTATAGPEQPVPDVAGQDGASALLRDLCSAYAVRRPVRTVAVVGNAPLAASDLRADLVDSCDLVLRVNGFALDGPGRARAVGRRADVVIFTRGTRATPWFLRDYRDRLYLLVEPGRMHWEPEIIPGWWPADLGFVPVPNREVTVPLSAALGFDVVREPHWATTGTVAAWLAHTLFPAATLHLSGFSFIDAPQQTSWEHEYGEPCVISPEHALDRESVLMRGWAAAGSAVLLP